MDHRDIQVALRHQPFRAFRLFLSDGKYYDVRHPDQVILTPRALHVGIGGGGRLYQEVDVVANVHITRIEPLPEEEGRKKSA